jgi:hypothetical protein
VRLIRVFALVTILAGVFASVAAAGGYTDASYFTPVGKVGTPYSHTVSWKPGNGCPPWTYAFVGGVLPPGLSVSSGGVIGGTPTTAGTYTFYIRMTDNCGPEGEGNAPFVIKIEGGAPPPPPQPALVLQTSSLAPATAGSSYSATLSASGGSSYSYAVTAGSLPPGLTLSGDGHLTGTPSTGGSFAFTVRVTDQSGRTATRQFTLEVKIPLAAGAAGSSVVEARRHVSIQLQASGGAPPYRWSMVSALPEGLFLDTEKGILVGAPRTSGTYALKVAVTDTAGATKTIDVSLTVAPKLHFVARALRAVRAGKLYSARIVTAGGVGPISFQLSGRLPKGLAFNAKTGVLRGRTTSVGRFSFGVTATDTFGHTSTRYLLVVAR